MTPTPAPNTDLAPDEERDVLGADTQIYADDIEGASNSDVSEAMHLVKSTADGIYRTRAAWASTRTKQCLH